MDSTASWWVPALSAAGVLLGLIALGRGLLSYRSSMRLGDTSTSTIRSLAAGEVRISGIVEPAELTLVSLFQSIPCVYYRSGVDRAGDVSPLDVDDLNEERSIGFRVRDRTGTIRVFPRGARVDAPLRFDEEVGSMGGEPPGLALRVGPATRTTEPDRASAIASVGQVHDPNSDSVLPGLGARERHGHRYREHRLEPGDAVTIVGRALPFSDLADPVNADFGVEMDLRPDDQAVMADLAEARAAGLLTLDPATAWGNAAIPGFGIGRPVSAPRLDPAANRLQIAASEEATRARETFEVAPGTLVMASSAEVPLLIAYGTPGAVVQRSQQTLAIGLLGAVLAIVSAMVLGVTISELIGP
jgi:hypothetical protein